jgi:ankyrin repeat protein
LHVAAEYGHLAAAEILLAHGADVDARAAVDADGLNGHTPLFHTVNANANRSASVMALLLAHGAHTDVLLNGITWGHGFPWATTCFDVTPISYAQFGTLPQFQRDEVDIAANVLAMLACAKRPIPVDLNIPNRYLRGSS